MKKINSWMFGILFMTVFLYFAWNNFELPVIFMNETKETIGNITDINIRHGIRGSGHTQIVYYTFRADDKFYADKKVVDKTFGKQYVGNRVLIEYSVKEPSRNKVKGFYSDYNSTDEKLFSTNSEIGYNEIKLINGIVYYKEYANRGKIVYEYIGKYIYKSDTLIATKYNFDDEKKAIFKYVTMIDSLNKMQLIDIETKRTYK